jgi:hypothetical protein
MQSYPHRSVHNSFITPELVLRNYFIKMCIKVPVDKGYFYAQVDRIKIPYYAHDRISFKILIFNDLKQFYTEIQLLNKCSNKRSLKIYI